MKPRIFVSSTFYDLKYVRENLSEFIRNHDFEPIMFEDGDVGYNPGKPLDKSCYDAMKNSDMAVLIIGGQYGSAATDQETDKIDEYISITQNEFRTAVNNGLAIFAFVDSKVKTEYDVYMNNFDKFKSDPECIAFRATKDIRVFKFIKSVYDMGIISVTEFNKITDITDFLSKQWSDMFKRYLEQKKERKEIETIKQSVAKLESLVDKMSMMLDEVGKKVIDKKDYDEIKVKQNFAELKEIFTKKMRVTDDNFTNTKKRSEDLFNMFSKLSKEAAELELNFDKDLDSILLDENIDSIDFFTIPYDYEFSIMYTGEVEIELLYRICALLKDEKVRELLEKEYTSIIKTRSNE
ncbi:MAG: DUF4062 domain-containing protein [Ruminococcus sp.]|uniref:DUF4062 domain-containing protein n=1 Tax=Ruminococcus sp. TaxID=41978 RepID=UPI0025FC5D0A|nr:DUF4062 domain-containing protein [Ruminococcus sp.]MCR5600590.1 DUF4062 domain-containing protein [Ruminococcus sp.]